MHKFFVASKNISGDKVIILDQEQAHHIYQVLRFKAGEKLTICDDKGNEYSCLIEDISKNKVILSIKEKHFAREAKQINIAVACAIPKNSKFDHIIDKLTQLGVNKIIPLKTERVVVKLDKNKEASRKIRWQKIALAASQQCQRGDLVIVEPVKDLQAALQSASNYDLKIIPTLEGERKKLSEIFIQPYPKNILVFIGPEGDFTTEEVNLAKKAGCIPVSLGDSVLRVETAAVAVASFIMLNANH
jgi:16S rRNA (uracil1498-N3)-methyltransferase